MRGLPACAAFIPMRYLIVLLCLSAACSGSPTSPSPSLPALVTLAPGASQQVAGTGLTLRFDRVQSDSRCPSDALCIQQGDAAVVLSLSTAASTATHTLLVNDRSQSGATGGAFLVTFETLAPYPSSTAQIDPASYRATFRVSRP
ncbi:MAG: hypothetical protein AB7H88_16330 [Vicinamibacterales bacterium]